MQRWVRSEGFYRFGVGMDLTMVRLKGMWFKDESSPYLCILCLMNHVLRECYLYYFYDLAKTLRGRISYQL